MRTIKFRYWNKQYYRMDDNVNYLGQIERTNEGVYMQYTGIKDKNGVEIYEGDILKWTGLPKGKDVYKVFWDEDDCSFRAGWIDHQGNIKPQVLSRDKYWKVIGNIYENKDLLK